VVGVGVEHAGRPAEPVTHAVRGRRCGRCLRSEQRVARQLLERAWPVRGAVREAVLASVSQPVLVRRRGRLARVRPTSTVVHRRDRREFLVGPGAEDASQVDAGFLNPGESGLLGRLPGDGRQDDPSDGRRDARQRLKVGVEPARDRLVGQLPGELVAGPRGRVAGRQQHRGGLDEQDSSTQRRHQRFQRDGQDGTPDLPYHQRRASGGPRPLGDPGEDPRASLAEDAGL
jgi:hypothetical protein